MLLKEVRLVLPMTLEDYKKGRLYTLQKKIAAKDKETFRIVKSQLFVCEEVFGRQDGLPLCGNYIQKTRTIPVPMVALLKKVFSGFLDQVREEAWAAFPFSRTEYTFGGPTRPVFAFRVDSLYVANERAELDNPFHLDQHDLDGRQVATYDMAKDHDPAGRNQVMTVYKLIRTSPSAISSICKVESFFLNTEEKIVSKFHEEMCKSSARWRHLAVEDQVKEIRESTAMTEEERKRLLADISAL